MKVALLIRSLERGGAERQLVMLARGLQALGVDVLVIMFYPGGPFARDLAQANIPVVCLEKMGRWDLLPFGARLLRVLREHRPDVLYGFVVTPNLLGSLVKPLFPDQRLVWGVRSARIDLSAYDWATRLVYGLETWLSRVPDLVIVNSKAGERFLLDRGFPRARLVQIPNGIDVDRYRPDLEGREQVRRQWGLGPNQFMVGIVARADPVKAHDVFLHAATRLHAQDPRFRFVCVGLDAEAGRKLKDLAARLSIGDALTICPPYDEMPAVYSALDVHVLCSHSEGFPNAVAESMACGTPCTVTRVGDAAEIVGDTGTVAPPNDPEALAREIRALSDRLMHDRGELQRRARERICRTYSLEALATSTLKEINALFPEAERHTLEPQAESVSTNE